MVYHFFDFIHHKYFDELNAYSPYIRQALLFKYFTEEIPLTVKDTDYIAGWYGYEDGDGPERIPGTEFPRVPILDGKQNQLRENLYADAKIAINFTPAHTCID